MTPKLERLAQGVETLLGIKTRERLGELTVEVTAADYKAACEKLKTDLQFEQLIDLCGVDYGAYGDRPREGARFAAVVHLLSVSKNVRLRVRSFCPDDTFPVLPSVVEIWPATNWFEREAFDLYGIVFEGHPDLRRILTDYGFIGHPFRKDFPLSGYVEMRYDPEQKRVVYEPVTIDPREVTPRIVREPNYAEELERKRG